MKDDLGNYMKRPKRYDNIDGTGEMYFGLMLLLFCLQTVLPKDSMWRNGLFGMLFMYMTIIPGLALGYWGVKAIKRHITWPRTGYVALSAGGPGGRGKKSFWIAILFVVLIAVGTSLLMVLAVTRLHEAKSLLRVGYLSFWVLPYAFWIFSMKEPKWKWFIIPFLALGLLAIDLIVPGNYIAVMLFVGLVWLGSGAVTLYLYIRHTQPPDTEAE
jgi:hypothetical protein